MGDVAADDPVGLEPALEAQPAQRPRRPQPAQPGGDEHDDPEHHDDRDAEQAPDEHEQPAEERAEVELGGGDRRGQAGIVVGLGLLALGGGPVAGE